MSKLYTLDEAKDLILGKVGTERRDQFEYELKNEILDKEISCTFGDLCESKEGYSNICRDKDISCKFAKINS